MSDFGTLIIATKKDNSRFTAVEIEDISSNLNDIITKLDYTDFLDEPYNHMFVKESDSNNIIVRLSEHFNDPDASDNTKLKSLIEDEELAHSKKMIEELKKIYDFDFVTEVSGR